MDRIRLMQFSSTEIDQILQIVGEAWTAGIQNTRAYSASFEIQLKGTPWLHTYAGNVKARDLVKSLLQGLYELGWACDATVTLCKKPSEKDTLVFRKVAQLPPLRDWFYVAFDKWNILSVKNSEMDFCLPLVRRFEANGWSKESVFVEDKMEISLKSSYWISQHENCVTVRLFLLAIVETLEEAGFHIYTTLRATRAGSGAETDMLVCARKVDLDTPPSGDLLGDWQ